MNFCFSRKWREIQISREFWGTLCDLETMSAFLKFDLSTQLWECCQVYDLDDIGNSNDDHSDDIGCKDKFRPKRFHLLLRTSIFDSYLSILASKYIAAVILIK